MKSKAPLCPYCGNVSTLTSSKEVYSGRDYGPIYLCKCVPNWAYVGCHSGTTIPMGRLADYELRFWKKKAHDAFDPLWRNKHMSRSKAYAWLANAMGIPVKDCHVGMFDIALCQKAVELCGNKLRMITELKWRAA